MELSTDNRISVKMLRQRSQSLVSQPTASNELVFRRNFSDLDLRRDIGAGGDAKLKRSRIKTMLERKQCKAIRVCFYRNLNAYFRGIIVAVTKERYRTFDALLNELTVLLSCRVKLTSAICRIHRMDGSLVTRLESFIDNDIGVCCCQYETFKNVGYILRWTQGESKRKPERPLKIYKYIKNGKLIMPQLFYDLFSIDGNLATSYYSSIYVVRHAHWRANKFVLKYVPIENSNEFLRNEKSILLKLQHHEHIVDLCMSYESPKLIVLLLEYLSCDLARYIFTYGAFTELKVRKIVRWLGRGLKYMHDNSIVHRDIKLENILINCKANGSIKQLKITDFGMSVQMGAKPLYQFCGTPHYMAPEILMYTGYNDLVDCWSMGVLIFISLTLRRPFGNDLSSNKAVYRTIIKEKYNPNILLAMGMSASLCDLIRQLLTKLPCARLSAKEILRHPFVRGIS